ncbi:MAG: alpha-galactosidase [Lachnospiraceae bacterium]|nr:alpha-galactosidase [Lachnospiraceae bacterium]
MDNRILINEYGLYIEFKIHDNKIVELKRFSPSAIGEKLKDLPEEKTPIGSDGRTLHTPPVIELQITGKSTRDMHGYKHNASSASHDLRYISHEINDNEKGKELIIHLKSEYDLFADYHMQLYKNAPVVRVFTTLTNKGKEALPIEYVSSFVYQNMCGDGEKKYFDKTDIYTPHNSWSCESHWEKHDIEDVNVSRMPADGFNLPGFGNNRYAYTGFSSWSSVEHLPMGLTYDREMNETYCFQVENSGQWHIEYDSEPGKKLTLCLSGPTEQEHGWWYNLKEGECFTTVPAAFGVVCGDVSEAIAALTLYRRAMRRENDDDKKLNVVFNDYMNCLMGDCTEEKDMKIIDKAAEMGCEYFCLDCGWYDKGYWWDRVGEWIESPERFPNGLKSLCDYAKSKGMVMGLWLEIEVMGTACKLADTLPDDWFVCRHGKRHIDNKRYLLDFRNPDVRKYCMDVVDRLVNEYGVGYFKVDYNVTMGHGSDLYTDSNAQAILDHYRALYSWYEEIFKKHPDLVIENCGSGAMRMDYGMLRLLSLQSTSDQTDYIYNSYIGTSVASAVTPEQAGMWVYPYEDDEEHVIYNMVNGLLLRPYMSGMVWKLKENSMNLLKEGVECYKAIRGDIADSVPFFPFGLNRISDKALCYGVKKDKVAYLEVLLPKCDEVDIPLEIGEIDSVEVIYPKKVNCEFECGNNCLHVKMPSEKNARLFKINLK